MSEGMLSKKPLVIPGSSRLLLTFFGMLVTIIAGALIPVISPITSLIGLGIIIMFIFTALMDKTVLLISVMILLNAVAYGFWLEHRIMVGAFPISIPDIMIMIYGLYGIIRWLRAGRIGWGRGIGVLLAIWFMYNSSLGLAMGLEEGNPAYAVLQEYRLILYVAIAYFTTLVVFHPERHLRVVIFSQIAAGLLVSIWQFWITLSGSGLEASQIVLETKDGIGRLLRDVGLPGTMAASALVVLAVIQIRAPTILGKARRWTWGLFPVFVAASFLSMTRTVWVSMALSMGLLFLFFVLAGRKGIRSSRLIILVAFFLAVIPLVFTMVRILFPEVYQALESVWDMSFSYQDGTFVTRLEQWHDTWNFLWDEGWSFYSGLGFGNISAGAVRFGPYTSIHNAYMWYMVIAGLPGLLLFLALWISPLIVYLRLLTRSLEAVTHSYVIASIVNWLVMSVVMLGSPALWTNAALFGMMLGIASVVGKRYADRKRVSPPKDANDLQFKSVTKTNVENS